MANQTIDGVPRHWAEIEAAVRGAFQDGKKDYNGCMRERLRELRALLDAPAKPVPSCVSDLERFEADGEDFVKVGDVIDMLGNLKAARPQGEPVAWVDAPNSLDWYERSLKPLPVGTKLYAEPPAPAVLPRLLPPGVRMFPLRTTYSTTQALQMGLNYAENLEQVVVIGQFFPDEGTDRQDLFVCSSKMDLGKALWINRRFGLYIDENA